MRLLDLTGSAATDALGQFLVFAGERQKVLANNVANIDTPGYRMRDLSVSDFEQTLARAVERSRRTGANLGRLDLPDVSGASQNASDRGGDARRLRGIVFHDDNDRSIESVVATMTKNAIRHNRAATLLRNQVRLLRSIISENVGS